MGRKTFVRGGKTSIGEDRASEGGRKTSDRGRNSLRRGRYEPYAQMEEKKSLTKKGSERSQTESKKTGKKILKNSKL